MEFRVWLEDNELEVFYRDNERKALENPEVQRQLKTHFQAKDSTLRSVVGKGSGDERGEVNYFVRAFNQKHGDADKAARVPWEVRHPTISRENEPKPTPEDLLWFRGSKVKERDGSPKVVYHGTTERFDRFEAGEFGFHFGDKNAANMMGDSRSYLLRITNPIRLPDLGVWNPETVLKEVAKKLGAKAEAGIAALPEELKADLEQDGDNFRNRRAHYMWSAPVREFIKSLGYDGIVYKNDAEGFADSYIAFDNEQIRRLG